MWGDVGRSRTWPAQVGLGHVEHSHPPEDVFLSSERDDHTRGLSMAWRREGGVGGVGGLSVAWRREGGVGGVGGLSVAWRREGGWRGGGEILGRSYEGRVVLGHDVEHPMCHCLLVVCPHL